MTQTLGLHKIVGRIRGLDPPMIPENREDEEVHMNNEGDVHAALGALPLADLVRMGDSWQILTAAWTAGTALPTTVAINRLWNGEPAGGKFYVIERVAVFRPIIDVTTIDQFTVFAQVVRPPVAAFTDVAMSGVISLCGKPNYSGRARKDTGVAASAETGRWQIIGTSPPIATAIAGSAWQCIDIPLRGLYIVPPGGAFCIHAAEVTATASALRAAVTWHEVQMPIVQ